jgi:hypothetical protein
MSRSIVNTTRPLRLPHESGVCGSATDCSTRRCREWRSLTGFSLSMSQRRNKGYGGYNCSMKKQCSTPEPRSVLIPKLGSRPRLRGAGNSRWEPRIVPPRWRLTWTDVVGVSAESRRE